MFSGTEDLTLLLGLELLSFLESLSLRSRLLDFSSSTAFIMAFVTCILSGFTLKDTNELMTAIALLRTLLDHMIFERILEYQASSKTILTEDHALRPVPEPAGRRTIRHDLYLQVPITTTGSVPYQVNCKYKSCLIVLRPAGSGTGLKA